jgi:hypothetical protein
VRAAVVQQDLGNVLHPIVQHKALETKQMVVTRSEGSTNSAKTEISRCQHAYWEREREHQQIIDASRERERERQRKLSIATAEFCAAAVGGPRDFPISDAVDASRR